MSELAARFISFEGGEGGGKTTQSQLLAAALQSAGHEVLCTREPGGEAGAEEIRALLVQGEAGRWEPMAETLLFLAARQQHVERVIKPALAKNIWVISDRFHDSTRVYQGVGKNISDEVYMNLHHAVLGNFVPDATFFLDTDVELGIGRSLGRNNHETRFEQMDFSFHQAVRSAFLKLAENEPDRIAAIDASRTITEIHRDVIARMQERFGISLAEQAAEAL